LVQYGPVKHQQLILEVLRARLQQSKGRFMENERKLDNVTLAFQSLKMPVGQIVVANQPDIDGLRNLAIAHRMAEMDCSDDCEGIDLTFRSTSHNRTAELSYLTTLSVMHDTHLSVQLTLLENDIVVEVVTVDKLIKSGCLCFSNKNLAIPLHH
jgi:hypothetical protein